MSINPDRAKYPFEIKIILPYRGARFNSDSLPNITFEIYRNKYYDIVQKIKFIWTSTNGLQRK